MSTQANTAASGMTAREAAKAILRRHFTRQEAADAVPCSIRKIDADISAGILKSVMVGRRSRRIPAEALDAYLQGRR